MTKYARFEQQKNYREAQDTTEYIAVVLNPGCWPTLHVCIKKDEKVVWCWFHLLQKLLWNWTEHIPHLHQLLKSKVIWQNIEDGTCVLIRYSQYVMSFSPQDCCESEKICNVVDNDQKLKGSNWWPTCIRWDFRSRRNA